jgi:hypothetical protein
LAVQGKLVVQLAQVLKARLIYDLRANNLGVADLQSVFSRIGIVALRSQGELTDALVVFDIAVKLIADGQGVIFAERIVKTRGVSAKVLGSRVRAFTSLRSWIFRRWASRKKDAFLLSGPPTLAVNRVES